MDRNLILVVEDHQDLLEIWQTWLEMEGYRVVTASNGDAAFEHMMFELPALVVADYMMPKMSGLQLLELLREDDLTKNIPFIIITAADDPEVRLSALKKGVDKFLRKPIDRTMFIAEVSSSINCQKIRDELLKSTIAKFKKEIEKAIQPLKTGFEKLETIAQNICVAKADVSLAADHTATSLSSLFNNRKRILKQLNKISEYSVLIDELSNQPGMELLKDVIQNINEDKILEDNFSSSLKSIKNMYDENLQILNGLLSTLEFQDFMVQQNENTAKLLLDLRLVLTKILEFYSSSISDFCKFDPSRTPEFSNMAAHAGEIIDQNEIKDLFETDE